MPEAVQRTALVFAAVPVQPTERLRSRLAPLHDAYVVAADQGAATALAFGYIPHVLVGDLDSLDAATLDELTTRGVAIETHPRDKDATDGQLAVERALTVQPAMLWLLGFLGGPRLDQELANVMLLARAQVPTIVLDEHNELSLVRPGQQQAWQPQVDEVISLIPLGEDVHGVHTQGLRWSLDGERLVFGDTRGVSNEPVGREVRVSIESGLLLVTRHFPSDGLSAGKGVI